MFGVDPLFRDSTVQSNQGAAHHSSYSYQSGAERREDGGAPAQSTLTEMKIEMKKASLTLLISAFLAQPSEAELVPGGDFQMYKPGTNYTVTATFGVGNNSFARGVGDGIQLADGTVTYSDGSPDGVAGDGIPDIDMPGWVPEQSGNDLGARTL